LVAVRHLTIAEPRRSESGKLSFDRALLSLEKQVAEFLKKVAPLRFDDSAPIPALLCRYAERECPDNQSQAMARCECLLFYASAAATGKINGRLGAGDPTMTQDECLASSHRPLAERR